MDVTEKKRQEGRIKKDAVAGFENCRAVVKTYSGRKT
jgi:hypothetical protein